MENHVVENEIIIESQSNDEKTKSNKKIIKSLLLIGIAVIYFIIRAATSEKDFNDMYGALSAFNWCTIGSDGSYMVIDTNPDDVDDELIKLYYTEDEYIVSGKEIQNVNSELGFPDSLYEKMLSTTSVQGRQIVSNKKYTVSWTYHPDKGLEVMYEMN